MTTFDENGNQQRASSREMKMGPTDLEWAQQKLWLLENQDELTQEMRFKAIGPERMFIHGKVRQGLIKDLKKKIKHLKRGK